MVLLRYPHRNKLEDEKMKNAIIKEICELVDVYGWSLGAAKAEAKSRLEVVIKARSKDEFVTKLQALYER
ncbi:MAG: hypothetical protein [Enterobacter phage ENC19]|nr:MAG: hypothetical protein [Enterobacter phage ENC19]